MASPKRGGDPKGDSDVPKEFANVPASPPMLDHSFTLQAVMELQKTVAELVAKTERLITDLSKQDDKMDGVLSQISFVKGAMYVLSGVMTVAVLIIGWYFSGKITIGIRP